MGLCPLEPPASSPLHKSSTFSYVTTVYKAVNIKTGQHMCLRRIHGYRLVNTKCMGLVSAHLKLFVVAFFWILCKSRTSQDVLVFCLSVSFFALVCDQILHKFYISDVTCQVDQWKKMSHSNLVTLRQVFTSKSFGDHSMVFVYDFFPGSETLMSRWLSTFRQNKVNCCICVRVERNLIDHTSGIFHTQTSLESACLTHSMATVLDHTG